MLFSYVIYVIVIMLSGTSDREEVISVDYFTNLIFSVMAGLIVHLISKWLDRNNPDN